MENELTQEQVNFQNSLNCVVFKKKGADWVPLNHPPNVPKELIDNLDKTGWNEFPTDTVYHTFQLD